MKEKQNEKSGRSEMRTRWTIADGWERMNGRVAPTVPIRVRWVRQQAWEGGTGVSQHPNVGKRHVVNQERMSERTKLGEHDEW